MHEFFIFIADFTPWQQNRIFSACCSLMSVLDPGFDVEALDQDGVRVGWYFYLTTDEARRRLIEFFTELTGRVGREQLFAAPAIQRGPKAASMLDQLAGAGR